MTPEEIKAKSAELAALYVAKSNGKTLQFLTDEWSDYEHDAGPGIQSDLSRWRVKPEPRRMWTIPGGSTEDPAIVRLWEAAKYPVTEWQEVLP